MTSRATTTFERPWETRVRVSGETGFADFGTKIFIEHSILHGIASNFSCSLR